MLLGANITYNSKTKQVLYKTNKTEKKIKESINHENNIQTTLDSIDYFRKVKQEIK